MKSLLQSAEITPEKPLPSELEQKKVVPIHKYVIRTVKLIGSMLLPVLILTGSASEQPVIIPDTLIDQVGAAEKTVTVTTIESFDSPSKITASNLLDDYLKLTTPKDKNQTQIEILNNTLSSDADYSTAISVWDANTPIFPSILNKKDKIRFVRAVLNQDDLDQLQYQSPDWGPDLDGDGVIETTSLEDGVIYNEAGEPVDTTSFVCDDYSRELNLRFGIQNGLAQKDLKFQLPMMRVAINEGYASLNQRNAWGRGHAFNAVFLGDTITDIGNITNWYFIEPQSDEEVILPFTHLIDGKILTLSIPHVNEWETSGDSLISFFLMPDGSLQQIDDVKLQILNSIRGWIVMNNSPIFINGEFRDDIMSDEPVLVDFKPDDIIDVVLYAFRSGYLDYSQIIAALQDAYLPPDFSLDKLRFILEISKPTTE